MMTRIPHFLAAILFFAISAQTLQAQVKKDVTIGIVLDGVLAEAPMLLDQLKTELNRLLESRYNVRVPADIILNANWSSARAAANYAELVEDSEVDIILGFGIISSAVIAREKRYAKPVIVLGLINPDIHDLAPFEENSSGLDNFSYILYKQSVRRDLDTFYKLYPYKNVGIVFFAEIIGMDPFTKTSFTDIMAKNNTQATILSLAESIDDVLDNLTGIDAIYLGHLGKFAGQDKQRLIDELTVRGIPVFSISVKDVELGALAAINPEQNLDKIFRRIALDIEAVLAGENLANLPVHLSFAEQLTINMATARKLNFSPDFIFLSYAELLYEFDDQSARSLSLKQVINESLQANLDIKIQELTQQADAKEVNLAYANFLPTVTIAANALKIDKDRAESALSIQAENTLSGSASLQQLIYSDQAVGNITIQKRLFEASEYLTEQVKLDIMLETGNAYFDVLLAQSLVTLRKDNLRRIKKNLEIAQQRETIGYSSRSEVFRWESELATETRNLIEAKNALRLTKTQLNRILHRPLAENFRLEDVPEAGADTNSVSELREYVKNPRSLEKLIQFFIAEAIRNSFEIRQLDASIAAFRRALFSFKRERYFPVFGLLAESEYVFSRSGAGSESQVILGMPIEPNDVEWFVGVNASLPVYRGGAIFHQTEQSRIEIMGLEQQKANLRQIIETNVRASVQNVALRVADMDLSGQAADFARKSFVMVQDAYAKGAVSIVELTDAQTNMLNAEFSTYNSVYDFHKSLLSVQRVISKFILLEANDDLFEFSARLRRHFDSQ
jgi:outer membrane protein